MAFVLIFSLGGCSGKSKAEETAKSFMDAYCEFDLKTAFEHLENKDAHTLPFDNFDDLIETTRASMEEGEIIEGMNSYVDKFLTPIYTKFVEKLSYSIESTEKQEDKFIVKHLLSAHMGC